MFLSVDLMKCLKWWCRSSARFSSEVWAIQAGEEVANERDIWSIDLPCQPHISDTMSSCGPTDLSLQLSVSAETGVKATDRSNQSGHTELAVFLLKVNTVM